MIKNLPTSDNFKLLARECLIQTVNNLYQIIEGYNESKKEGIIDFAENEIWNYHKGDLRTCLILVHQGFELYLKSKICDESPLLLLETSKNDWPTNPNSPDKDFNELFTISGEPLIRIYNAIQTPQGEELNKAFESLRKRRNVIIHSSPEFDISPNHLLESTIQTITLFEGGDQWWNLIKQYQVDHPLFGWSDYDYELSHLLLRLQFLKNYTSLGFLNQHTIIELKSRKYLCPYCTKYLMDIGYTEEEVPRWSFLRPNEPTSKKIFCFSCQQSFEVERIKCNNDECKGNVLHDGLCLTCNNY